MRCATNLSNVCFAFSFIFLFLGVLGNTAVIIYNIFLNKDKTPSSWLIKHLAFADLLVCLAFYLTKIIKILARVRHEEPVQSIQHATLYFSLFLSMMMLLSITIDKYLYIAKPLKYPLIMTPQRVSILLRCIWLAAMAQLPPIYIYNNKNNNDYPRADLVLLSIQQLVTICVIIMLNYKMFKIVKDQRQRMASEVVLQELQPEKVQSERLQPQQEQAESAQIQSEQAQSVDKRKSEQEQSEQVQSEQVQSQQIQSKQIKSKEIQSEQVQSKQKESERIKLEQVQSEQNRTWLRNLAVELKAMKTFAIIVGVLTCTFVPYFVVNMIPTSDCRLGRIAWELVGINSIANAFIYALRHKKYIRAYRQLFSAAWTRLFLQNN